MRRMVIGVVSTIVGALLLAAGLAYFRPEAVPEWARLRPVSGDGGSADSGLYCKEHGVPEKFCTLCHEELTKSLMLCKEHGDIPEDICTLCHPEVEKKHNIEMCPKGHGLPKAFCVECGKVTSASAASPDDGWCGTHNTPESLCEDCLMAPAAEVAAKGKECRQPLPLVRLASPKLVAKVGLEFATAEAEKHAHTLEANAEAAFDANRHAEVTPRVAGFLREARADLGKEVMAGEVLAVVDSSEVSSAKSRYIASQAALRLARAAYERTEALARRNAAPAKEELESLTAFNQAETLVLETAQLLRNLGFGDSELARILEEKDTSSLLPIVAPIGGTVIERHAVRNEPIQATTQLFAIADTTSMWVWIDIYESDVRKVKPGQAMSFTVAGMDPADAFTAHGKVTWIGATVDEKTRTTRVRAEIGNPDGRLRANQFGQAVIQVGDPHEVVVIPKAAVQSNDGADVVFLPDGAGVFRPQRILSKPSARKEVVEVAWGLKAGDRVVTKGSFWLKTEIMKGAIGAGCCE